MEPIFGNYLGAKVYSFFLGTGNWYHDNTQLEKTVNLEVPLEEITLLLFGFWTDEELPPIVLVQFVHFFKDGQSSTFALQKGRDKFIFGTSQEVLPLDDASLPRRSAGIV